MKRIKDIASIAVWSYCGYMALKGWAGLIGDTADFINEWLEKDDSDKNSVEN